MPVLLHLAPATAVPRILRHGIRRSPAGRDPARGVFCMASLPERAHSLQWLRELRRRGARELVAVEFRLPSGEPAWVGHYGRPRVLLPLGRAVGLLRRLPDPRGYEIVIPRRIEAREILRARRVPQVSGWRYEPDAHGKRPCPCPVCLPRGSVKSARLRERLERGG